MQGLAKCHVSALLKTPTHMNFAVLVLSFPPWLGNLWGTSLGTQWDYRIQKKVRKSTGNRRNGRIAQSN